MDNRSPAPWLYRVINYDFFLQDSTPSDSQGFQHANFEPEIWEERVIVDRPLLMQLFRVCSVPGCGSVVDPDDVIIRTQGAAMTVKAHCLNHNHTTTWSSSRTVGEGREVTYVINILLAAYTLFCGLNLSQVDLKSSLPLF